MKRIYSLIIVAAVCAAFVSCSKETVDSGIDAFTKDLITFVTKSADEVATKATGVTEVTTANLAAFNVVANPTTGSGWSGEFSKDVTTGKFTGGKSWPASDPGYTFLAANATINGSSINVSNSDVDIVTAYLPNATYKAENTLTFGHILCQLGTVTMKAPEGYTVENLKVKLNPIYSGSYNITTSGWSSLGTAAADTYVFGTAASGVTLVNGVASTSADNDLWLVPGEYVLTASYTIKKGDTYSKDFTKSSNVTLVIGRNNNLVLPGTNHDEPNIPEPDDISDIIFNVIVTPWQDNDIPVTF